MVGGEGTVWLLEGGDCIVVGGEGTVWLEGRRLYHCWRGGDCIIVGGRGLCRWRVGHFIVGGERTVWLEGRALYRSLDVQRVKFCCLVSERAQVQLAAV